LKVGDTVTLIDAGTLTTNANLNQTAQGEGLQGVSLKYKFDLIVDGDKLNATVAEGGVSANSQSKSFSEGFLSGTALLIAGSDFVTNQGLLAATDSLQNHVGWNLFGVIGGGDVKYKTGSHVDMQNWNLILGVASRPEVQSGQLTLAAFIEYGKGDYDSYNSFNEGGKNSGDAHYYGIGGLMKMQYANNWYSEASLRFGHLKNEFDAKDLKDANGVGADYDTSGSYASFHLGGGYLWQLNPDTTLDTYAKFFYTRQEGDKTRADTGEQLDFDDIESKRLRLGGRFTHAFDTTKSLYAGLAYEYEFDGKAKAKTYGYQIDDPELKGSTGIGELGVQFKPKANSPLSIDLGIQGYVGQREGVTGGVQANWAF
jgi:outer membrane autotransporter protein